MRLFKNATLGEWISLVLLIGTITVFLVRASVKAETAVAGVGVNKTSIEVITERMDRVEDTVLTLGLTNSAEHRALEKTTRDTYKIVKLLAEKEGIIVP